MATRTSDKPPKIFESWQGNKLMYWLSVEDNDRLPTVRQIRKYGGDITPNPNEADLVIAFPNEGDPNIMHPSQTLGLSKPVLERSWVPECIHQGRFIGPDENWGGYLQSPVDAKADFKSMWHVKQLATPRPTPVESHVTGTTTLNSRESPLISSSQPNSNTTLITDSNRVVAESLAPRPSNLITTTTTSTALVTATSNLARLSIEPTSANAYATQRQALFGNSDTDTPLTPPPEKLGKEIKVFVTTKPHEFVKDVFPRASPTVVPMKVRTTYIETPIATAPSKVSLEIKSMSESQSPSMGGVAFVIDTGAGGGDGERAPTGYNLKRKRDEYEPSPTPLSSRATPINHNYWATQTSESPQSTTQGSQLFRSITTGAELIFWVQAELPQRKVVLRNIVRNGGCITSEPRAADFLLLSPSPDLKRYRVHYRRVEAGTTTTSRWALSPKWLTECLDQHRVVASEPFVMNEAGEVVGVSNGKGNLSRRAAKELMDLGVAGVELPSPTTPVDGKKTHSNARTSLCLAATTELQADIDLNMPKPIAPSFSQAVQVTRGYNYTEAEQLFLIKAFKWHMIHRASSSIGTVGAWLFKKCDWHSERSWGQTMYSINCDGRLSNLKKRIELALQSQPSRLMITAPPPPPIQSTGDDQGHRSLNHQPQESRPESESVSWKMETD